MSDVRADRPTTAEGQTYHLHTKPGDLAPYCLLVGDPERAEMIAREFLEGAELKGAHRGLKSYTGRSHGVQVSVVTTGMGAPSTGIVLPEAVASGARTFIRVGSCSALQRHPKLGDSIIVTGAVRLEGASRSWAPIEYPAFADWVVVAALARAAKLLRFPHYLGIEATTDDFNEGQARPDPFDPEYILPRLREQHEELQRRGVLCYSMEAATLFVWCSTHDRSFQASGGGYLAELRAGAINATYGNRVTNEFGPAGEREAAQIALRAIELLAVYDGEDGQLVISRWK